MKKAILSLVKIHAPAFWINCSAFTQVDNAEDERKLAYAINADAPGLLAKICTQNKVQLIHFSSDYVYHQEKTDPLLETDICSPKSQYAKSKYLGEQKVLMEGQNHVIIRTSWLYSPFGNNFVHTIIKLAKTRNELHIVDDQIGAPTYSIDLANDICKILELTENQPQLKVQWKGIFNYANGGKTNWLEFAKEIVKKANIKNVKISAISSKAFNAKALRPSWSVMSTVKIRQTFGLDIDGWKTSLHKCINEMIN